MEHPADVMERIERGLKRWQAAAKLPHGVYPTRQRAREMLNQQPFTAACRDRHEIVPVYDTNLLGERTGTAPTGYGFRLKTTTSR